MFDRILFDKAPFDRAMSSEDLYIIMVAKGNMLSAINILTPNELLLKGNGDLILPLTAQQKIPILFSSSGALKSSQVLLKLRMPINLTGAGELKPKFVIRTPIPIALNGSGEFAADDRVIMIQNMVGVISGAGGFVPRPTIIQFFDFESDGSGEMLDGGLKLWLPLLYSHNGVGQLILRRLGTLNENVFELEGINLQPGETIVIDTNTLQVLFGATEDVSAVTSESVFFEMNPGENDITIDIDSNSLLNVVAIWQNRWL